MLYRGLKRAFRASFTSYIREGLFALAAAQRRRLLAFAMLDQKGQIGQRIVMFPR
jgi:hypothetical protein